MDPSRFQRLEAIYLAVAAADPDHRPALLDEACGDDAALRQDIEQLLADQEPQDALLDGPASDLLDEIATARFEAGTELGGCRIEGLLGTGGMGEVYLAYEARLERRVAIKVLPERMHADPTAREGLRREALAAAGLDHPFICKVFEVGDDEHVLYYTMEYVRGETLHARLRRGAEVRPSEAFRIAGEIAEALAEAHVGQVIHRDLKPGNVMLTAQGHVKVMDFGLARRATATVSPGEPRHDADTPAGTLQYMSPEQVTGESVDHRSDLFSFGLVLAELFFGRHPFARGTPIDTAAAILREAPDLSATDGRYVPEGLAMLIGRLLAKSPTDRYASMEEVRADLSRLADRPMAPRVAGDAARPLVIGRQAERAVLERALDAAMAGRGEFVLLGGEPGIGKSHLARAVQADALGRACVTTTGHCYETDGAPPFVPFVEMLEQWARALPPASFRHALGSAAPEVARLAPELRRVFPDLPAAIDLPPEQQRRFLFNSVREFLDRAARLAPIVAVFEDLHWADESTLLLLLHVVYTLPSMPMLVIGTYRTVDLAVNRPFARTLDELLRGRHATPVPLRRLTADDTATLLQSLSGKAAPPSTARAVYEKTEGNPFFIEEVFRHVRDEGHLFDESGAWREDIRADALDVPESVRLVIGRRLERLPDRARGVLTTAAILGRSADLHVLEALDDAPSDATLDAVEAAERAQLLGCERQGATVSYRFAHELVRQTLIGAVSLPRRQRIHARIAEALQRVYPVFSDRLVPVLAHHLYQAGALTDSGVTVTWLRRAAQLALAASAFEDALVHLDAALSLLPGENSVRVAEIHAARATALRSLAQMPPAIRAFEEALSVFELNQDAARVAETAMPLAMLHSWQVRPDVAAAICNRGLTALGDRNSPERALLLYTKAVSAALSNDLDVALDAFEQAERVPMPPLLRAVAQMRTYVRVFSADLAAAREEAQTADRLCADAGDLWGQAEVAWMRADLESCAGRLDAALAIAQQTIPIAERIGHWGSACFCEWFGYEALAVAGDLAGAAALGQVLEAYDRERYVPWSVVGHVTMANIARLRGQVEEAAGWCARAVIPEKNHWGGYPHAARALVYAQVGDARMDEALKRASPFLPLPGAQAPYGRWPTLNLMIEALAFAGRTADAGTLHAAAEHMLDRGFRLMKVAPLPRTTAGIAAGCAGQWTRAEEHHRAAVHQAETWPRGMCPPIARYWYGEMLRKRGAAGDAVRALDLLREAHVQFERLNMPLYARRTRDSLATLER